MKAQAPAAATLAALAALYAGTLVTTAAAQTAKTTDTTTDIANTWWSHGYVEAGGRFFLNNPQKNGVNSQGGQSLAKFYEYRDLRPGPFVNGRVSAGTNDGLYQIDIYGKNVGYDDQRLGLDASKAGEHYFNFQWDETPHLYSNSAQTIYNGVGTNQLTLPAGLSATLYGYCNPCAGNLTAAQAANVQAKLNQNLHQTDIGIRRDTASVEYRWTPTTEWDIQVNYDHMHRSGTQVDNVVWQSPSGVMSQVPKPVDDTTQNYGINGEYAGTSPWGQKFNFKLGYAGSTYTDGYDSYTIDNPFCLNATTCARGSGTASSALMSLWPSNQANGFSATLGADLPAKSRYMGTFAYTMMRQNQAFLPFTNNPNTGVVINGQPAASLAALPASSLNGAINTVLSNNVVTTQITPDLKSKMSYRYYDYQNDTPELYFSNWILTDSSSAAATSATYAPVRSLSVAYTKQNGDAELNWRPERQWNLGAGYVFERYDWTRADVDVTNEHGGKAYIDWKPWIWLTARASMLYSERRYDNYNANVNFGSFQFVNFGNTQQSTAMRAFYLNDRNRNKGQFSVAVDVLRNLTITPTFGYLDDVYNIPAGDVGLTRNQSWVSGVDISYVISPGTTLLFSYTNEQALQNLRSTGATAGGALTAANTYSSPIRDQINTFIGTLNYAAIPDKLDLKFAYTLSLSKSHQAVYFDNGTQPGAGANYSQYPDVRSTWQRFEASAKYTFDKEQVQALGWTSKVFAKLTYAWERNSVDNWQNDVMQTYMYTATAPGNAYGFQTWLAYDNPNYNVHMLMASLGFKW